MSDAKIVSSLVVLRAIHYEQSAIVISAAKSANSRAKLYRAHGCTLKLNVTDDTIDTINCSTVSVRQRVDKVILFFEEQQNRNNSQR